VERKGRGREWKVKGEEGKGGKEREGGIEAREKSES